MTMTQPRVTQQAVTPKSRKTVAAARREAMRRLAGRALTAARADLAEPGHRDVLLGRDGSKWRHGWIPLNPIAASIKAKKWKGHGGTAPKMGEARRVSKTRVEVVTAPRLGKARPKATGGKTAAYRRYHASAKSRGLSDTQAHRFAISSVAADRETRDPGQVFTRETTESPAFKAHAARVEAEQRALKAPRLLDSEHPAAKAEIDRINAANGHETSVARAERTGHVGDAPMSDLAKRRTDRELHDIAKQGGTPESKAAKVELAKRAKKDDLNHLFGHKATEAKNMRRGMGSAVALPGSPKHVTASRSSRGNVAISDAGQGGFQTVNEGRLASLLGQGHVITGVRGGRVHTLEGGTHRSYGQGLDDGRPDSLERPRTFARRNVDGKMVDVDTTDEPKVGDFKSGDKVKIDGFRDLKGETGTVVKTGDTKVHVRVDRNGVTYPMPPHMLATETPKKPGPKKSSFREFMAEGNSKPNNFESDQYKAALKSGDLGKLERSAKALHGQGFNLHAETGEWFRDTSADETRPWVMTGSRGQFGGGSAKDRFSVRKRGDDPLAGPGDFSVEFNGQHAGTMKPGTAGGILIAASNMPEHEVKNFDQAVAGIHAAHHLRAKDADEKRAAEAASRQRMIDEGKARNAAAAAKVDKARRAKDEKSKLYEIASAESNRRKLLDTTPPKPIVTKSDTAAKAKVWAALDERLNRQAVDIHSVDAKDLVPGQSVKFKAGVHEQLPKGPHSSHTMNNFNSHQFTLDGHTFTTDSNGVVKKEGARASVRQPDGSYRTGGGSHPMHVIDDAHGERKNFTARGDGEIVYRHHDKNGGTKYTGSEEHTGHVVHADSGVVHVSTDKATFSSFPHKGRVGEFTRHDPEQSRNVLQPPKFARYDVAPKGWTTHDGKPVARYSDVVKAADEEFKKRQTAKRQSHK